MDSDEYDALPRRRSGIGIVIVVSFLTSAVVSLGVVLGLPRLGWVAPVSEAAPESTNVVQVPSVTGMPSETAGEVLETRRLRVVVRERRPSPSVQENVVLEQTPLAGSRVPSGSEVTVVVSAGPPQIAVPDVSGKPVEEARGLITSAGLRVAGITESGTGPAGTVTATNPAIGTVITPDQSVTIVATPAAPPGVVVPEVVGLNSRRARQVLEQAGFVIGRMAYSYNEDHGPYIVLRQSAAAGTTLPSGATIDLVVNEGE